MCQCKTRFWGYTITHVCVLPCVSDFYWNPISIAVQTSTSHLTCYLRLVGSKISYVYNNINVLQRSLIFCTDCTILLCCSDSEKVSFRIASDASYVYILSWQKLIKNSKNAPFWRLLENSVACGQTLLPDKSILIGQKLAENAKMAKIQMGHFE